jgi:magnesium transporter
MHAPVRTSGRGVVILVIAKEKAYPVHMTRRQRRNGLATNIPIARPDQTIGDVERLLLKNTDQFETINYIYIVSHKKLVGVLSVKELFRSPKTARVRDLMHRDLISMTEDRPLHEAAWLALRHDIKAIPIIDRRQKFVGVIPSDMILHMLHRRQVDELLRTAGLHSTDPAHLLLHERVLPYLTHRLPWLLIGLAGGLAGAGIVHSFSKALEAELLLAAFIPAIAYMADAVGTQTQTILIRSLAIEQHLNMRRYLLRESITGAFIATILGSIAYVTVMLWGGRNLVPFVVGSSIAISVLLAMIVAVSLPLILRRLDWDPAVASGPFATVLRDILSLTIYFTIANVLLSL